MRAPEILLLLLLLLALGCEGVGEGQVSGTLFLRGCPEQGAGVPATPAPFQLDPRHFLVDTIPAAAMGMSADEADPRIPDRLVIRLQRSSHRPEFTDGLSLYLTDVRTLRRRLGQPVPVTAAPLEGGAAPLPTEDGPRVRAALWLYGTCPSAFVNPSLRGSATFGELGHEPGEWIAGDIVLTVEDPRGVRLGLPEVERDAAGQLGGSFRVRIMRGRSVSYP